jgi:Zn-dependent protease with chaperone function
MQSSPKITEESASYAGAVFSPELGPKAIQGRISISAEGVHFTSPEYSTLLPSHGLRVHEGGHNGEQIFLDHPEFPGLSIYTSDAKLLEEPALRTHPTLAIRAGEILKSRKRLSLVSVLSLTLIASLVSAVVLLFLLKDRLTYAIAKRIPTQWEVALGDQMFEQFKTSGKVLEKSRWDAQLRVIEERLLPAVNATGYKFQFHVMQDTNANAFAMPGGYVVILTGLLERARTSEEVAGVLAHELAHVTRKHVFRQVIQTAGLFAIVQAIAGDASGLIAIMANSSRFLLQQQFSRAFEREADDAGWDYLIRAKIDPRGMTRFFEQLRNIETQERPAIARSLTLLQTHPATRDRIAALEKKWEKLRDQNQFISLPKWETVHSK